MPSRALLAQLLLLRPLRRQLPRPAGAAVAAAAVPQQAAAAACHSTLPACLAPLSLWQPWAALQSGHGRQSPVAAAWSSSSMRGYATGLPDTEAAAAAAHEGDAPRRRRRGTTESRAVLRRTTESRAAIEDVAVMSKSQLMRRNKPWLAEQCWHHKLPHEGLKEELVQRLLAWQPTEAGKAAAEAAIAAAAAARAAQHAAPAVGGDGALTGAMPRRTRRPTSAAVPAGAGPDVQQQSAEPLVRPAAGTVAAAVAADAADGDTDGEADADDSGAGAAAAAAAAQAAAEAAAAGMTGWQPPLSAAAAAASSLGLFLTQLRAQPGNAAAVAAARRALEQHGQALVRQAAAGGGSSGTARQLAAEVAACSSPASLAALAKACFSREVLDPLLAAALAEAVAGAAPQLGPHEVHGVLRLLVEHRSAFSSGGAQDGGDDAGGARALDRAFEVLAEAMIRCSAALRPVQLAEAVALLGAHGYDDALGLFLLAKEAAARLGEFEPVREGSWVVVLLDAIAGMHIADEGLAADVVAAVSARRGAYSREQLAAIDAALRRMGAADGLPAV